MDYVCPVDELEQRLKEAAQHLTFPHTSTNDLLQALDKIEHLLTYVGQAPSITMQGALVPSMGALIADGLLKHSEIDVKVSVASCLCEVARITAPKPPYKDEIMKEIFQLNVLAFGQLSNVNGQNYLKAVHILESVAKVKSYLLMLDLECDALVLTMFEHLLSEIRVNHPHPVFSDMEVIMTNIIEESDEIATELLSLLISNVKKYNRIVRPASFKLAETVLRNCKDTLKAYSVTIMKLINSNPDNYVEVVTVLCQNVHENGHVVTRSRRTNSTHKRDLDTLENGGSMKKQKYIDKNQLKGKELETPRRGRPKNNENSLNQGNGPKIVQNSRDTRSTRSQDKKQSSKTNGNIETLGSLYNVVIKKEDETLSDYGEAEPLVQQKSNDKIRNRRKSSSNKRVANGSRSKEIPKKWKQDLVGHRVKVWWPLDKMYYEGAVSSYDPLENKYKVLYSDGDEELLDLHSEKWMMLDEISPDQQQKQVADLTSPINTPAKRSRRKGKRKLESSPKQDDDSNAPKSPPRADSSKTVNVICNADNQKNSSILTPGIPCGLMLTEKGTDDMMIESSNPNGELNGNCLNSIPPPADSSKTTDVICNADNQKNAPVLTPDISCGLKLTEKATDDMEKNGDSNQNGELQEKKLSESSEITQRLGDTDNLRRSKRKGKRKVESSLNQEDKSSLPKSPPPADSSKTSDVICNAGNQKIIPIVTPEIICGLKLTEKATDDMENGKSNPNGELNGNCLSSIPPPADSSKTAEVICNADNQKNAPVPVPTPDISCGPKSTEKATDDMKKNVDPNPNGELQEKKLSESSEITQILDTPDISCGLKLTEKATNDMAKNGDSNPNGELQEKNQSESSEITQRWENTDNLVCET